MMMKSLVNLFKGWWKKLFPSDSRPEVVIYGGSFNPIHRAHVEILKYLEKEVPELDQIWIVPSMNPLKDPIAYAPLEDRVEMIKLSIKGREEKWKIWEDYYNSVGSHYTVDILEYLTLEHPELKFSLFIGMDSLVTFKRWKDWEKIIENHKIYVACRPGSYITSPPADLYSHRNVVLLNDGPLMNVSSSEIRRQISVYGSYINLYMYLFPEVLSYIEEHNLYRPATSDV